MGNIVVVGGGISGLLAAEAIVNAGFVVVGLEASEQLGGRLAMGHHRLYSEEGPRELEKLMGEMSFLQFNAPPLVRLKGEWTAPNPDQALSEGERLYLREKYKVPRDGYGPCLRTLIGKVGVRFQTRKLVTEVDGVARIVRCEDGEAISYDKLAWCASLRALRSCWQGDKSALRTIDKLPERQGGISLEMELTEPLLPSTNTVFLPFRFKEWRLQALGFNETPMPTRAQWLLFLDDEILEDREEVAKCVRTLKREIVKEFPKASELCKKEKITYLPVISGESPLAWPRALVTEDVAYLGPEVRMGDGGMELRNLDLTLANYPSFRRDIEGWRDSPNQ